MLSARGRGVVRSWGWRVGLIKLGDQGQAYTVQVGKTMVRLTMKKRACF